MFVVELGSPAKGLSPSCSFPETPIKLSSETFISGESIQTTNSPSNITNQTTPNNILTTTNIQHVGSSSNQCIETTTNLPDTFVDLTAYICDIEENWYADLFVDPYDDAPGINDIPSLPPSIVTREYVTPRLHF